MKSVFQEASSLGSAIEKAWEAIGSPEGFEVKILKSGERGFLGFCKVPYAVRVTAANKVAVDDGCESKTKDSSIRVSDGLSESIESRSSVRINAKESSSINSKNDFFSKKNDRMYNSNLAKEKAVEKTVNYAPVALEVDSWTEVNACKAEEFLSTVLTILGLTDFSLQSTIENNFLRVFIVTNYPGAEFLEKTFFVCIAPLIVQMVKKSTGEHSRGLRIVINEAQR